MNKSEVLKKNKWLKDRRRSNKIRKHKNYVTKTHKGIDRDTLRDNLNKKKKVVKNGQ